MRDDLLAIRVGINFLYGGIDGGITQELDRDLKGRVRVGRFSNYWQYDGTVEHNRQLVREAIAKMKETAKELRKVRVEQNTNIISADE